MIEQLQPFLLDGFVTGELPVTFHGGEPADRLPPRLGIVLGTEALLPVSEVSWPIFVIGALGGENRNGSALLVLSRYRILIGFFEEWEGILLQRGSAELFKWANMGILKELVNRPAVDAVQWVLLGGILDLEGGDEHRCAVGEG